jgi:hypothetical protein
MDPSQEGLPAGTPAPTQPALDGVTPNQAPDAPYAYGLYPWLGAFWVLCLIALGEMILVFSTYAAESYVFSLVGILVFFGVLHVGGRLDVVQSVVKRPWRSLAYIGLYVVIGVGWIGGYWANETHKAARVAMDDKQAWLRAHGVNDGTVPANLLPEWKQYVAKNPKVFNPPNWYERKSELAWRGMLWPVSMVHTALADLVYEFYLWIVELYGRILDHISKWMFSDVLKELNPPAPQAVPAGKYTTSSPGPREKRDQGCTFSPAESGSGFPEHIPPLASNSYLLPDGIR